MKCPFNKLSFWKNFPSVKWLRQNRFLSETYRNLNNIQISKKFNDIQIRPRKDLSGKLFPFLNTGRHYYNSSPERDA
ncbi:unnamed protein product [Rhizophagus irregularis]|nr:unnamed protein product [Rhizophagus irregularis]